MKALLIIDMQNGSFKPYTARYDTLGVIERINNLSSYFRNSLQKVILFNMMAVKKTPSCLIQKTGRSCLN
jgi:nicotinamidase-related amidase